MKPIIYLILFNVSGHESLNIPMHYYAIIYYCNCCSITVIIIGQIASFNNIAVCIMYICTILRYHSHHIWWCHSCLYCIILGPPCDIVCAIAVCCCCCCGGAFLLLLQYYFLYYLYYLHYLYLMIFVFYYVMVVSLFAYLVSFDSVIIPIVMFLFLFFNLLLFINYYY